MDLLVDGGLPVSGTTAQRPAGAVNGTRFFNNDTKTLEVFDGTTWQQGGGGVVAKEVTFTETALAGVYTGSVTVPAGATVLDVIVHAVALWTAATSATMIVGDATDPNGIYDAIDLKATDLLAGESLSFSKSGGKAGAYNVGTDTHWTTRYLATARVISGIVTTVGTTGNAGRTRMTVVYSLPSIAAAVKVAT